MATYELTSSIPATNNIKTGDILNCAYSGTYKSVTLPAGQYKLEVWGAQGGGANSSYKGGKGGYSKGTLTLTSPTTMYLYAGQKGSTNYDSELAPVVFNGGGRSYGYGGQYASSDGGGGSDIRINSTSLYARVIVAGGGGGGSNSRYTYNAGGAGGGTAGTRGYYSTTYYGNGGSQTAAGTGTYTTGQGFGVGGYYSSTYGNGGGGGWYGGAANRRGGAGGGSGYVYTSSTASNYPSGCLLNSTYYLSDAATISGDTTFTPPSGGSETGHAGNGYARITVLSVESGANMGVKVNGSIKQGQAYVKVNGTWKEGTEAYVKVNGAWKKSV